MDRITHVIHAKRLAGQRVVDRLNQVKDGGKSLEAVLEVLAAGDGGAREPVQVDALEVLQTWSRLARERGQALAAGASPSLHASSSWLEQRLVNESASEVRTAVQKGVLDTTQVVLDGDDLSWAVLQDKDLYVDPVAQDEEGDYVEPVPADSLEAWQPRLRSHWRLSARSYANPGVAFAGHVQPVHSTSVAHALSAQLGNEQWSDVRLQLTDEVVPAHRVVLAAQSPVLAERLQSGERVLHVDDSSSKQSFKLLLRYMYTGKMELGSNVLDVLREAIRLQVRGAVAVCVRHLVAKFTAENVCQLLGVLPHALYLGESEECAPALAYFEVHAYAFVEQHTLTVLQAKEWTGLPPESLCRILSSDALGAREVDVFRAVLRWGAARCSEAGAGSMAEALERVLPLIRFPLMTPHELACVVLPVRVVAPADIVPVFNYLGLKLKYPHLPLPDLRFSSVPRSSAARGDWSAGSAVPQMPSRRWADMCDEEDDGDDAFPDLPDAELIGSLFE